MSGRRFDDVDDQDGPLPWLEPVQVEEEPSETYVSRNLLIGLVALFLALLGGGIWLLYDYFGPSADYSDRIVPLVRAPDAPYRVPAGMAGDVPIDGEDARAFDVAAGLEPSAPIDLDAVPEAPLPRAQLSAEAGDATPAPAPASVATPPATAPAAAAAPKNILPPKVAAAPIVKPAPVVKATPVPSGKAAPAAGGAYGLQLGAFSSGAKADAAWKTFSQRYSYLAPLQKQLQPLARDGKTLYRLVATGAGSKAEADKLCAKLRVAGESCMVVP